jgi:hypothetical protein
MHRALSDAVDMMLYHVERLATHQPHRQEAPFIRDPLAGASASFSCGLAPCVAPQKLDVKISDQIYRADSTFTEGLATPESPLFAATQTGTPTLRPRWETPAHPNRVLEMSPIIK